MQKMRVEPADAGSRLDVFLTKRIAGVSRSRVQKWIKAGEARVNDKKATPHLALEEGDEVLVSSDTGEVPNEISLIPRPDIALDVVYEDADVIVVNKPSGMLVHPAVASDTATLANALIGRDPAIAAVGDAPERPGIVHRLDKDASGLIVAAKTKRAFEALKSQFKKHEVEKKYAVLVDGAPPKDEGTVSLAIGRSAKGGKMAARHDALEGDRDAVTHYRIEERFSEATLLSVRTETGRTHQIRAHMNALGCPVVGDALYGDKMRGRIKSPRLFLHAKTLAFAHPITGKRLEFSAPLPQELQRVLDALKK